MQLQDQIMWLPILLLFACGHALSSPKTTTTTTRRNFVASMCTTTATGASTTTALISSCSLLWMWEASSSPCAAACLPGDTSKECIGVYKVPMDDAVSGMVGTKEALERNAPGLNYVPPVPVPKSAADARLVLEAQRQAADDIRAVVAAGRLEEAGIKVLNLVPKVTAAGRVVVDTVAQTTTFSDGVKEVQLLRLQSKLDETLGNFGQVDVDIGQGLRGEMGVVTAAQLQILADLKDAMMAFDDFLTQIPR